MDSVVSLLAEARDLEKTTYRKHIQDFIQLSRRQQLEPSAEGLGEPRYRVDGTADTIEWARPQYDGPALRVLALLHFMEVEPKMRTDAQAVAVVRTDLEFVARIWRQPCFDLWEELRGRHLYTQAVQYSALRSGAKFFSSLGESEFAVRLDQEATEAELEIEKYWDSKRGYIGASINREVRPHDPNYKDENLDTSVILAALHSHETRPQILSFTSDRLLATAHALERAFTDEYTINHGKATIAIGRFTDDVYFGGNPWYMTTAAFAELYYQIAHAISENGAITVSDENRDFLLSTLSHSGGSQKTLATMVQADSRPSCILTAGQKISTLEPLGKELLIKLRQKGDGFLEVIRQNTGEGGHLAEQFDRNTGAPISAVDLTWSYASYLSAILRRPL